MMDRSFRYMKSALAVAGVVAMLVPAAGLAADEPNAIETETEKVADAAAGASDTTPGPVSAASGDDGADENGLVFTLDKKGLQVKSRDGAFAVRLIGRLHVDGTGNIGDVDGTDGTELRRARIGMQGKVYTDWFYKGEVDFGSNLVSVKDFFAGYSGFDNWKITVGNQKQPYSMGLEMSSNDIPFVERGIDNFLLTPFVDRAIGLRVDHWGDHFYVAAGIYGGSVTQNTTPAVDDGWGTAGRFIYSPIVEKDNVLHLGFRGAYRQPTNGVNTIQIKDETTNMSNLAIVDTGKIMNESGALMFGPEATWAYKQFSLGGEYNKMYVSHTAGDGADLDFQSGHVTGTWTITGESRAAAYKMKDGEFKRLTPKRNFSLKKGGWGAWELAARYAYIGLNSGSGANAIVGGEEHAFSSELNWYLNPNIRLMFNWTRILGTDDSTPLRTAATGLNVLTGRLQLVF